MGELKPGWRRVKFGDMVTSAGATRKARGWNSDEEGIDRYVGLEHLDSNGLKIRRWGSPDDVGANSDLRHFDAGDVILARRGIELRKLGWAEFSGVASGHALVFRAKPEVIIPQFLPFFMQSDVFMNRADRLSVGSLSHTVNLSALLKEEFALPPLAEQKRLLLPLLAAQHLNDSVFAAMTSTLDLLHRTERDLFLPQGTRFFPNSTIREVGSGWRIAAICELCRLDSDLTLGPFGSDLLSKDYSGRTTGIPIIFVRDIRPNSFNYKSECYVSEAKALQLAAHVALPGDLLVTKVGVPETMGIPPGLAAVLPDEFPRSIITADVIRARIDAARAHPRYVAAILNTAWGRQQTWRISPGSTTRFKMTLANFSEIRLPIPPLEYQLEVVDRLEKLAQVSIGLAHRQTGVREIQRHLNRRLSP